MADHPTTVSNNGSESVESHPRIPSASSAPSKVAPNPSETSLVTSEPSDGSNNPVMTPLASSGPSNGSGNLSKAHMPSSRPSTGPTSTSQTPAVASTRPDDFNIASWISSVSDPSYRFDTKPPTPAVTSAPPSHPRNTPQAPAIHSTYPDSYHHMQAPVLPIPPLNRFAPIAPSTNLVSTTPSTKEAAARLMAFVDTSHKPATPNAPQSGINNTPNNFKPIVPTAPPSAVNNTPNNFKSIVPTAPQRRTNRTPDASKPSSKDTPLRRPIETYKSVILLLEQNSCLHANGNKITCRACMSDFQFLSKKGTGNITSHLNSRRHLKKLENFQNYTTQGLILPPGPITKGNRFHLDLINLFCQCDIPIEKVDDEMFVSFADKHLPFGALSASAYRSTIANVINKLY